MGVQLQVSNLNFLSLNSGNRTTTLRARQAGALKWVLIIKIAVPPLLAKLIVKSIPEGRVDFLISRFVTNMINW